MGVACARVSRSSWTKTFLDVVIWPIEQWINFNKTWSDQYQYLKPPKGIEMYVSTTINFLKCTALLPEL